MFILSELCITAKEARGNNGSTTDIENVTTSIAAVAEAYPELKSNENYKELMNELSTTENMILQYRTAYNNEVRAYKKYVRKFPYKQILGISIIMVRGNGQADVTAYSCGVYYMPEE